MSYRHENEGGAEEDVVDGDIPAQITELAQASVPDNVRGIRACKRCGILKTLEQFLSEGCENCPFLSMVRSSCFNSLLSFWTANTYAFDTRRGDWPNSKLMHACMLAHWIEIPIKS